MRMVPKVAAAAVAVALFSMWAAADGADALSLPLKGLTKDNMAQVEAALTKLERNGFRCASCGYFSVEQEDCPSCGTALVAEKAGVLLRDVKVDSGKGAAMFGVASPAGVRLSEIDVALKTSGVSVDRAKLPIAAFTRLRVTGITSDEDAKALDAALKAAKLFDGVKTHIDIESETAAIIVGGAKTPPTYETFSTTIAKAGSFKLEDVEWTAACPKCKEKGAMHANCMSCWEKHP